MDIARKQIVRRRLLIGLVSLPLAAGGLAGCSVNGESSATAPIATTPAPSGPVINLSSLMTWRNDEPITHTITSGRFIGVDKTTGLRSSQDPDGTFEATLPGKFHLHQTRHIHLAVHNGDERAELIRRHQLSAILRTSRKVQHE